MIRTQAALLVLLVVPVLWSVPWGAEAENLSAAAEDFIVDGDAHDVRYAPEERGHWIVLHAKGRAGRDTSGFVYRPATPGGLVTLERQDLVQIRAA